MSARFESLDGLRGLAALNVAAFHFLFAYAPNLIPGRNAASWWGSDTPFAILYNGSFAVEVFFVLSGFVVSNSAAKRHLPLTFNLVSRYVRLAIPVLGGTIFGWALLTILPHTDADVASAPNRAWLDWFFEGHVPGFLWAARDGLFGVFVSGRSQFDPPLWTMKLELIGSAAIYLLYGFVGHKYRPPLLGVAVLLAVFALERPAYAAFALGALLREAMVRDSLGNVLAWPAIAFGVVFGAMMEGYGTRLGLPVLPSPFALGQPHQVWQVAAAAAILYGVLTSPILGSTLSNKPIRFLGDISFGLYLVHAPVLRLFGPFVASLHEHLAGLAILLTVFLALSVVLGLLFNLLIDKPTLMQIRRCRALLRNRNKTVVTEH